MRWQLLARLGWELGEGGVPSVTEHLDIVERAQCSVSVLPNVMSVSGCCKVGYND